MIVPKYKGKKLDKGAVQACFHRLRHVELVAVQLKGHRKCLKSAEEDVVTVNWCFSSCPVFRNGRKTGFICW